MRAYRQNATQCFLSGDLNVIAGAQGNKLMNASSICAVMPQYKRMNHLLSHQETPSTNFLMSVQCMMVHTAGLLIRL